MSKNHFQVTPIFFFINILLISLKFSVVLR